MISKIPEKKFTYNFFILIFYLDFLAYMAQSFTYNRVFLELIALLRYWYINPNEKQKHIFSSELTYLSFNEVIPSMNFSIKVYAKCKTSFYALAEICHQWRTQLGPLSPSGILLWHLGLLIIMQTSKKYIEGKKCIYE